MLNEGLCETRGRVRRSASVCGANVVAAVQPGPTWEREFAEQGIDSSFTLATTGDATVGQENQAPLDIRSSRYVKYVDRSIFNYNAEQVVSFRGAILASAAKGSVFRKGAVVRAACYTWAFALLLVGILFFSGAAIASEDVANFRSLVMDFHNMCTFLLGFFISTCLARWWAVRADGIGGLWGNVDDIVLLIGAFFPRDTQADRDVREQVLRWGALSHELMYKQARNEHELRDLVEMGLLTQGEMLILEPLASRPQVIWAWMCSFMAHLAYGDPNEGGSRLPQPVTILPQLLGLCCKARDAIGIVFTYTDSQVPFRYVHVLSFIVWMHNLIQALTSAVRITYEFKAGSISGTGTEIAFLMFYPVVYTSLLHVGVGMLNPMRAASDVDFPKRAFTYYMLAENRSFYTGSVAPHGPPYSPGRPPIWKKDNSDAGLAS